MRLQLDLPGRAMCQDAIYVARKPSIAIMQSVICRDHNQRSSAVPSGKLCAKKAIKSYHVKRRRFVCRDLQSEPAGCRMLLTANYELRKLEIVITLPAAIEIQAQSGGETPFASL